MYYTENSKRIFPEKAEKELRGHNSKTYDHVSVCDLYTPSIGLLCIFCCRKIDGPVVGIYNSLTDT
jgi:hypothetical protein